MPNKFKYILPLLFLAILINQGCTSTKDTVKQEKHINDSENYIDTSLIKNYYAKNYVISASTSELQRDYASAILDYLEALKYDSSASIMWAIAKCYKNLNRKETALNWAINSYIKDSTFAPNIELIADLYFTQFKFDNAVKYYEILSRVKPTLSNRMRLAVIYEFSEPEKAINIYESITEEGDDLTILNRLAELYHKTGKNEKYIKVIEKLFDYSPSDSRNAYNLIEGLIRIKEYPKVFLLLEKLEHSISLTDYSLFLQLLATSLIKDSSDSFKDNVSKFLSKIDNKVRFDWKMQLLCAYLADKIGDTSKSELFIYQSLIVADSINEVVWEISNFYFITKKDRKAIEFLSKYDHIFPEDYKYPFFIALAYSNLKNYDTALTFLQRALEITDTVLDVWSQIGIIYDQLGMVDSSEYAYKKALDINPKDALVNNNLAYSYSVRGINLDKALDMIKISLYFDPFNPSYLDTYAWILFKTNDLSEALKYVNKAIELGGGSAEVWEHKGDILEKMGNITEAKNSWEKALNIDPKRQSAKDRLKIIK